MKYVLLIVFALILGTMAFVFGWFDKGRDFRDSACYRGRAGTSAGTGRDHSDRAEARAEPAGGSGLDNGIHG